MSDTYLAQSFQLRGGLYVMFTQFFVAETGIGLLEESDLVGHDNNMRSWLLGTHTGR